MIMLIVIQNNFSPKNKALQVSANVCSNHISKKDFFIRSKSIVLSVKY